MLEKRNMILIDMTINRTNIHQASLIPLSSLLSVTMGFILVANTMLQGKKIKEADIFSNINMSPFPLKRRVRNGTCSLQDIWKLFKYFIFFFFHSEWSQFVSQSFSR